MECSLVASNLLTLWGFHLCYKCWYCPRWKQSDLHWGSFFEWSESKFGFFFFFVSFFSFLCMKSPGLWMTWLNCGDLGIKGWTRPKGETDRVCSDSIAIYKHPMALKEQTQRQGIRICWQYLAVLCFEPRFLFKWFGKIMFSGLVYIGGCQNLVIVCNSRDFYSPSPSTVIGQNPKYTRCRCYKIIGSPIPPHCPG